MEKLKEIKTFRYKEDLKAYFLREMEFPKMNEEISKIKEAIGLIKDNGYGRYEDKQQLVVFQYVSKEDEGYLCLKEYDWVYLFDSIPNLNVGDCFVTNSSYEVIDFDKAIIEPENLKFIRESVGKIGAIYPDEFTFKSIKKKIEEKIEYEKKQEEQEERQNQAELKKEEEENKIWANSEPIVVGKYSLNKNIIKIDDEEFILSKPYGKCGVPKSSFDNYRFNIFDRLRSEKVNFEYRKGEIVLKIKFRKSNTTRTWEVISFINGIEVPYDKYESYIQKLKDGSDLEKIKKYPAYVLKLEKLKEIRYDDRSGTIVMPVSFKILKEDLEVTFWGVTKEIERGDIKALFESGRGEIRSRLDYGDLIKFSAMFDITEGIVMDFLKKKRMLNMLKEKNGST